MKITPINLPNFSNEFLSVFFLRWLYGLGFFTAASILTVAMQTSALLISGRPIDLVNAFYFYSMLWLPWSIMLPIVYSISEHFRFKEKNWIKPAIIHFLTSIVWLPFYWKLIHLMEFLLRIIPVFHDITQHDRQLFTVLMDYYWYWVILISVYLSIYYDDKRKEREKTRRLTIENLELSRNLAEARLSALKAQLQPHFFFNSLNAASGLIRESKKDEAIALLTKLGQLLRHYLEIEGYQWISLEKEIEFQKVFLAIQIARFEKRLKVDLSMDEQCKGVLIPVMVLQPLVENAVHHGIGAGSNDGLLSIKLSMENTHLLVEIENGICSDLKDMKGFGIGLKNIRSRLNQLFQEDFDLELSVQDAKTMRTRLVLPASRSEENALH